MKKLLLFLLIFSNKIYADVVIGGKALSLVPASLPTCSVNGQLRVNGSNVLNMCSSGTWTPIYAGGVTTVTATSPLFSSGGVTPNITIQAATTSQNGYLSSTDWNTFTAKAPSSRLINTTAPLAGGGNLSADRTLTCNVASGSQPGCLSSANWTTFNGKQDVIFQESGGIISPITGYLSDQLYLGPSNNGNLGLVVQNNEEVHGKLDLRGDLWMTASSKIYTGNAGGSGDFSLWGDGGSGPTVQFHVFDQVNNHDALTVYSDTSPRLAIGSATDSGYALSVNSGASFENSDIFRVREFHFEDGSNYASSNLDILGSVQIVYPTTRAVIIGDIAGNTKGNKAIDIQSDRHNDEGNDTSDHAAVASGVQALNISTYNDNYATGAQAATIGGGANTASGQLASIIVGVSNNAAGQDSVIVGGTTNTVNGLQSGIFSGTQDYVGDAFSSITGGSENTVSTQFSFVGGGSANVVSSGSYSSIVGGNANQAIGNYSFIGGGMDNSASSDFSASLSGQYNTVYGIASVVTGGATNQISNDGATISGGIFNQVSGYRGVISGGENNYVSGSYAGVFSGISNYANNHYTAVLGGESNNANGYHSAILGGEYNSLNSDHSVVLNGNRNLLSSGSDGSAIMGDRGATEHMNSFVQSGGSFTGDVAGENQWESVLWSMVTPWGASEMFLDGSQWADTKRMTIASGHSYACDIDILGVNAAGDKQGTFKRRVLISNVGGTTAVKGNIGTPIADTGTGAAGIAPVGWSVTISADNANSALKIAVVGDSTTTRWTAHGSCVELKFN